MKCQKCGKYDANTHITEILNGKKTEVFLCPFCAQLGGNAFGGFKADFGNIFSSLWPAQKAASTIAPIKCPNCKTTLSDIQKSGHFGCSECYATFFDYIKNPIKEIHGSTKHIGKVPKQSEKSALINDLKKELETSVALQNFEKAAELRDRIKELENRHEEV